MKHVLLIAAMACMAAPAIADPVVGLWRTQAGDDGNYGVVEMVPCGDKICGTLVRAFDAAGVERQPDTLGRQIVWDMLPMGSGAYDQGKIWAPDRDKTYRSKMELQGDVLKVSGCVGPFCRGQDWTREK